MSVSYIHRNLPQKGGKVKKIFIMYEVQPSAVGSESQLKRSSGGEGSVPSCIHSQRKKAQGLLMSWKETAHQDEEGCTRLVIGKKNVGLYVACVGVLWRRSTTKETW